MAAGNFANLPLLATPGCWDRSDPELLAIVLAVAFDLDEKNELYQVIAQVVDPVAMGGAQSGDGGGGGGGAAFWTVPLPAGLLSKRCRTWPGLAAGSSSGRTAGCSFIGKAGPAGNR